ncbi:hypothetical protein Cni_G19868 [Canna indica]|uniref:Pistil-specific extensin-like protein n=1 Tax=Canna indica TaxID=4628 RepID=A0AAQ3KNY9_9LILI|nr:hypothetical protein Cni_G19868 [Canna indica]
MTKRYLLLVTLVQPILLLLSSTTSSASTSLPHLPPRHSIAVEGKIYCKCELPGYVQAIGASPLPGAVAMIRCNSSRKEVSASGITDARGYFLIQTRKVTRYGIHKCELFLVSSPLPGCDLPGGKAGTAVGFPLRFARNTNGGVAVYTAGAFKFAPADPSLCPHHP